MAYEAMFATLDHPGFPLCWVAMLSCSTWVLVVLMNNNVEHALPLCYIYVFNKRSYALIGTWSDHPGQQCNH
jgi:hypothetical protein